MSRFYLVNTRTGELKDEFSGEYCKAFTQWFDEVVGSDDIKIIEIKG